jgi:hypothetical protein
MNGEPEELLCWTVTNGAAGFETQVRGLAEAVGGRRVALRVELRRPWNVMPPLLVPPMLAILSPAMELPGPPWPDLIVSCGRNAVAAARAIRRASAGRSLSVHVQAPNVPPSWFDIVVAPAHDRLSGANVLTTQGAIHDLTDAKLAAARLTAPQEIARLQRPLLSVSIGGDNRYYRLGSARARAIAAQLAMLSESVGLAITPSRRTFKEAVTILRDVLAPRGAYVWDGTGSNPYLAMLAIADYIAVTEDSVSMVSEAAATGKPVHLIALDRVRAAPRFERFHRSMLELGVVRPLGTRLENWSYKPLDDTQRVGRQIRALLVERAARR